MKSDGNVTGAVMVVGGGIAGIQASLDLAESGLKVYLVERRAAIGGKMAQLDKTFPTNDCAMCIISPKLVEAGRHLNIDLMTHTEVEAIEGEAGNFEVTVKRHPRYIDIEKCTACGECAKVCPVALPDDFNEGINQRRAAYKQYPQAMPGAYAIDKKGRAPCKAGCPLNPSIQGCFALIRQGDFAGAYRLFRQEHPFPAVCGRVCHHPCEIECTRSEVDQPLSIRHMHRFLADWARENPIEPVEPPAERMKERVAVIGSGPGGLACAYFLASRGYGVTVFEKHNEIGGMLTQGIPAYRLPRTVIDGEVQVLKDLGIEFRTGVDIGTDTTIGALRREGYGAFFLAVGSQECKLLGLEGEDLEGVVGGLDYLRRVNGGESVPLGDRVAVIGGGNVAMDAVRTALRWGAKAPFIIYRRSEAEMPAGAEEVAECRDEGIDLMPLTNPVGIIRENGRVTAIECQKMELGEPDESGRRRPVPIPNSEFTIQIDTLMPAIGQESDWACLTEECACTLSDWGTLEVDPLTLQTSDADIFAGGDAVTGPRTVVEALAAGKEAALSIERFLKGEDLAAGRQEKPPLAVVAVGDQPHLSRQEMVLRPGGERRGDFEEVALGFDEAQIRAEAERCLQCGNCSECYLCEKACLAEAVNHQEVVRTETLQVGAVVLAPGFKAFDPLAYENYAYAQHPNVVTSLEFERLLSASGPNAGHLVRPADDLPPKKIAWLQCVGSRDIQNCDNAYCSSVCCMYACKQAVIAKEHSDTPLDTAIFFMDLRTYGKDFDRYQIGSVEDHGVRFIRSRIHSVLPTADHGLRIVYATEKGTPVEEVFDMVILSVGLSADPAAVSLAGRLGIDLNGYGFVEGSDTAPTTTSRKGIFACGAFTEPKDIPYAVMEASAAAAQAARPLSDARWSLTVEKETPEERDTSAEAPRIGVFVCNCGINIGGVADVPAVRDYAKNLPHVVHVEDNLFTCSQDSIAHLKVVIEEHRLNRVVVASCSPRTHEPLFQETIREAGLNAYLFEMANIRDQNTWVHMDQPELATEKAKALVRMAVAKVVHQRPLYPVAVPITPAALVVGGGAAGMAAALDIADQGPEVFLVEKGHRLGGHLNQLRSTWQGVSLEDYRRDQAARVEAHPRIHLYLGAEVSRTGGSLGQFSTEIATADGTTHAVTHAVTVLATGGREHVPEEYLYGKHPQVLTHLDLDQAMTREPERLEGLKSVVFIQCVGSRTEDRPHCSKVCCTHSLKAALALKKQNPVTRVVVLYRDIRTYGLRETLYQECRRQGVLFIRYTQKQPPSVAMDTDNKLLLTVVDPLLDRPVRIRPDMLVLAAAILPNANQKLYELFKVPVNAAGFLVEAHAKLRPVELASEGIFLAGLAHYPKPLEESIAQAQAAASKAMTLLAKSHLMVGGVVAEVDAGRCAACLTCVRTCPYHIPQVDEHSHAVIDPALCHGCGACAAECPGKAITLAHFTDDQLIAKSAALVVDPV
jgi:heterodisulfide reductase subunit A-like polyferredoxin